MRKSKKIRTTNITLSLEAMKPETYILFTHEEISLNSCRAITYRLGKNNGKKYVTRDHEEGLIVICMPLHLVKAKVGLARKPNRNK